MTPKNFINCKVHKLNLSGLMFIPIFFNNPNECKRTTLHSFPQHDSLENTINKSLVDLIIFCLKINITLANHCHLVIYKNKCFLYAAYPDALSCFGCYLFIVHIKIHCHIFCHIAQCVFIYQCFEKSHII
jgi:hypothetical protein